MTAVQRGRYFEQSKQRWEHLMQAPRWEFRTVAFQVLVEKYYTDNWEGRKKMLATNQEQCMRIFIPQFSPKMNFPGPSPQLSFADVIKCSFLSLPLFFPRDILLPIKIHGKCKSSLGVQRHDGKTARIPLYGNCPDIGVGHFVISPRIRMTIQDTCCHWGGFWRAPTDALIINSVHHMAQALAIS